MFIQTVSVDFFVYFLLYILHKDTAWCIIGILGILCVGLMLVVERTVSCFLGMPIRLHALEHHTVINLSLASKAPSRGRCVVWWVLHVFYYDYLRIRSLPCHIVLLRLNKVWVAQSPLALHDLRLLGLVKDVVSWRLHNDLVVLLKPCILSLLGTGIVSI